MASIPTQDQGVGDQTPGAGGAQGESPGATDQAKEKAQELAGQAGDQARQAAGQAKDQLRTQVDERSTQVGEQVAGQAGDIRTVAEQLREQGKDKPAELAEQAADRVERVGSYLRDSDADRILSDVEDFARRRPWAVVAGGIALGLAAGRFLKASSSDRYHGRTPGQLPTTTTRPAGTAPAPGGSAGGSASAPLRPAGNGHGAEGAGPAPTGDGPPTSTGAL